MGNIQFHSESSAQKFGGKPQDYVPIHKFLDQSKLYIADWRHRSLLHSTFGIAICEQLFGDLFPRASDQKTVCTRSIIEVHILEDMGAILTPGEFLREMPIRAWMNGLNPQEKGFIQSIRQELREKEQPVIPPVQTADLLLQTSERAIENRVTPDVLSKHEIKWGQELDLKASASSLGRGEYIITGCKGCQWKPKPLRRGKDYISYYQQWVEHLSR